MVEILAAMLFFGLCFAMMSIGVIVSNRRLKGSCGGAAEADLGCGVCARKDNDVCPSDDELVRIAQIGHPDPRFHR